MLPIFIVLILVQFRNKWISWWLILWYLKFELVHTYNMFYRYSDQCRGCFCTEYIIRSLGIHYKFHVPLLHILYCSEFIVFLWCHLFFEQMQFAQQYFAFEDTVDCTSKNLKALRSCIPGRMYNIYFSSSVPLTHNNLVAYRNALFAGISCRSGWINLINNYNMK